MQMNSGSEDGVEGTVELARERGAGGAGKVRIPDTTDYSFCPPGPALPDTLVGVGNPWRLPGWHVEQSVGRVQKAHDPGVSAQFW